MSDLLKGQPALLALPGKWSLKKFPYVHLQINNILHRSQHGFCRSRSTTTNLLECFNDWTLTILSKEQQVIVYIDFSKAFDVVSHPKLFARLHSHGVRGAVLLWLKSFFAGRSHQTKVESTLSDTAVLLSGVVQGSGIGPLMFLTYINELISILEEFGVVVKLFADGVKMYVKIINDVGMVQVQHAVSALVDWAREWQLAVSIEKCCVLNIGQRTVTPHVISINAYCLLYLRLVIWVLLFVQICLLLFMCVML